MTRPVFIGGAGRSGTTLLVDLLGTHPELSPIYETDFVTQVAMLVFGRDPLPSVLPRIWSVMDAWTRPLPHRPHNKREHERYLHGPHHVLFTREFALARTERFVDELAKDPVGSFRRFVVDLFDEHARLDGKKRWINKTPAYVQLLPALRVLFPDMIFLHCVRDGRDVTRSVLTRPWGPATMEEGARWWADQVARGLDFQRRHPEQAHVVRYEDVLSRPEETMAEVLGVIGEDPTTAFDLVESYRSHGMRFDPERTGGWRAQMNADQQAAFWNEAGEVLARLDYEEANYA